MKVLTEDILQPLLQQMLKMVSNSTYTSPGPGDVSIHQLPHRQLSAVRQTRRHSDAAIDGLSKVTKVI